MTNMEIEIKASEWARMLYLMERGMKETAKKDEDMQLLFKCKIFADQTKKDEALIESDTEDWDDDG